MQGAYGSGLLAALDGTSGAGLASLEGGGDRKEGGGSDGQSNGAGERHVERDSWVGELRLESCLEGRVDVRPAEPSSTCRPLYTFDLSVFRLRWTQ